MLYINFPSVCPYRCLLLRGGAQNEDDTKAQSDDIKQHISLA
jgi:hypothetical protein